MRALQLSLLALSIATSSVGCGGTEDPAPVAAAEMPSDPAGSYGAPLSDREEVALADIVASPETYEGQTLKTSGEIAQVCQQMGCWMEIRASEDSPGVRVPMANHSYFLPQNASGHQATIEGVVALRELSEGEREHLESEGAQAAHTALQITATGVVIQ